MKSEAAYQRKLIQKLQEIFPGCVVLKNDPSEQQGIPDLLILHGPYWAMLEVKLHANSRQRPNQDYHIQLLREMSFASFIYPENEDQVLYELQSTFGLKW